MDSLSCNVDKRSYVRPTGLSSGGYPLDGQRDGVAAAQTEARDAAVGSPSNHFVNQRHQNARPRSADGVPERDRSAVHVDLLRVKSELLHQRDRLRRKGLVEFE